MNSELAGVFFCSGARNHKLLDLFPTEITTFEVDERVASFKALGLSKDLNRPVVICTTSGTAVSECLSAMIEAFYSEVSLVLVSADRPKELHGTGAPQTIDHEIITRNYRREYIELNFDVFKNFNYQGHKFPLHVNVLIRSKDEVEFLNEAQEYFDFSAFLKLYKSPLFLFSHAPSDMRKLIERFSEYKIPFYAETLSQCHELSPIRTEKKLLSLLRDGSFDSVVRIGHTPLSKCWRIIESLNIPVYNFDSRGLKALSQGMICE